jgi:hypothetical protein
MKIGVVVFGVSGLVAFSSAAFAQAAPPARVGFQMDVRTGYSVPMGSVDQGEKLSDFASGQVPLFIDIGGKVIPQLFVGGYLGFGFGVTKGALKQECDADNASCSVLTLHLGVEAQYHILPDAFANPWIGYGLGFESLAFTEAVGGDSSSASVTGFEFARFMGGVDLRLSRAFGIGPFIDLSVAQYSREHVDNGGDADIPNKATHEWLTLGVRAVFFP